MLMLRARAVKLASGYSYRSSFKQGHSCQPATQEDKELTLPGRNQ